MAKQDIYLGVEGNDGTGDSIREAFRKANENFTELYAVFGQGGTISFTALNDTPTGITQNGVLIGNSTGTALIQKTLTAGQGINIDNSSETNITITNTGANINADTSPNPRWAIQVVTGFTPIGLIATSQAITEFNTFMVLLFINDLVQIKSSKIAILCSNTTFESQSPFTLEMNLVTQMNILSPISEYRSGNVVINNHGFDWSSNGTKWKYTTTDTAPNGLTDNTDYYIPFVNEDLISLHTSKAEAQNNNDTTRLKVNINLGPNSITNRFKMLSPDTAYDSVIIRFLQRR